ncbi:hypothetical protein ACU10_02810 [Xanthomonas oryzae pv. oryzicola]|uniref:immunity protein YezG family protein n=1 Tax=Xanthomonas oryzae TaxID=347 RepID=UPI0006559102|nr:immunity protein YezG family protein [Xanthomonas oryzae]AKN92140.1 hypothetical protein ACU13_02815 [Xanthomonas oryzae pv. oryzicola]AKN95878.1 hypothetical protein ACU10_02810 [Xanthomonas oryzae pv. oryzicola]AKO11100.1 hypothetical protein ACU14_02795 [Xanthomonas oryzae pv. oryzicola]AKO14836.1 hypothetical protein ACU12_02805 [Xanthomonas oryzae pv. oryzicola]
MKSDNEIYNEIASILVDAAPADAEKLKINAEMKHGDDHCKSVYYYENKDGHEDWFIPNGKDINEKIMDLLIDLRRYFRLNNLFKDGSPWVAISMVIDINKSKVYSDFFYE